jgi:EAL domain-containing protein (putative c-di-GMP-specific phosphodiesterase class I)
MLHRVMESISAPYTLDAERVVVTASIGYTVFPQDDADADALLRHADQAMYAAKQAGRNRFHQFDAAQERALQLLRTQGRHLRDALADAQFTLYLQPKVDMKSGAVVGAEALARWQHPQRGLVPPGEFLPLLEGTELEIGFGEWVVEAALSILEELQARGMALPLSVNIAAQHLQRPDFADWMARCIARHPGVPAHLVEIEITESAALYDLAAVAHTLTALRGLGVVVSLDDFGTGYSSLTYLRRLPMDTLKIDQSFVHGMMGDPGDLAIVQGVIGLARSFGYRVIAEGVETIEQGQMLLQLGCTQAQGYCIARPMPLADFTGWAARWQLPPGWQRQAQGNFR